MAESKSRYLLLSAALSVLLLLMAVTAEGAGKRQKNETDRSSDGIKHLDLTRDGCVWVELGGRQRLRFEVWDDFAFGDGGTAQTSDSFLLSRTLAHADLHLGPRARIYVEGKSALSSDRDLPGGERALDVDDLDLQQAYAQVSSAPGGAASPIVKLRVGRQELTFGAQRLISPLDWSNTRRTFEGMSVIAEVTNCKLIGFWSRFVPVRPHDFNRAVNETELWGLYGTGEALFADTFDLYWLGTSRDSAAFNGTFGREERHTLGTRMKGDIDASNFDYEMEGAYQFGELGDSEVNAGMWTAELGYRFKEVTMTPRPYVGFDYASGDDSRGGRVGTFNQLFPLGHAYLGYIDAVGRQNVLDYRIGCSIEPASRTTAAVDLHVFRRVDRDDALYNAGGAVIRAGSGVSEKDIGAELDLTLKHRFSEHTNLLVGYSHFFAGQFIEDSGPAHDIDFAYTAIEYSF